MTAKIRAEEAGDLIAIGQINRAAFERPDEARLVNQLRERKAILHSLVAETRGVIVGHALFTPMLLHRPSGVLRVIAALGPVAVLPDRQGQGIGSALIRDGIRRLRARGYALLAVLGHASYYPRFGFVMASTRGVRCAYEGILDEAFMVLTLAGDALPAMSGEAHYHPLFDDV
jgi:putative acetyltransferase